MVLGCVQRISIDSDQPDERCQTLYVLSFPQHVIIGRKLHLHVLNVFAKEMIFFFDLQRWCTFPWRLFVGMTSFCECLSKIIRTDAVKIIKLTIRPIGRHHSRSSSLPHVDTGPSDSSIFGTLPVSPFLSQCQALFAIRPGSPQ
jgi:hypothetical protein